MLSLILFADKNKQSINKYEFIWHKFTPPYFDTVLQMCVGR